jgi:hypothetical protein
LIERRKRGETWPLRFDGGSKYDVTDVTVMGFWNAGRLAIQRRTRQSVTKYLGPGKSRQLSVRKAGDIQLDGTRLAAMSGHARD